MSFIRAKEIPPRSGNWYDYEVKSVWINGKPRQEHIRYIGKSSLRPSRSSGGVASPVNDLPESVTPVKPARITKCKQNLIIS